MTHDASILAALALAAPLFLAPAAAAATSTERCPDASAAGTLALAAGGLDREVLLLRPDDVAPDAPLVVVYHGLFADPGGMVPRLGLEALAREQGAVVVVPRSHPKATWAWGARGPGGERWGADLALFDRLVDCLEQDLGIDGDGVVVAGFSAGAIWTSALVAQRSEVVSSVVQLSGGLLPPVLPWRSPTRPVSALLAWGGPTDFVLGGPVPVSFRRTSQRLSRTLRRDGHAVVHCVHGEGHSIPPEAAPLLAAWVADAASRAGRSPGFELPAWCLEEGTSTLELVDGEDAGDRPLAVVAHGIHPTAGDLDPLVDDLELRGFAVAEFTYDDTQPLEHSARQLGGALGAMLDRSPRDEVTVVAHSMGGLVARRALTGGHASNLAERPTAFVLVTVASPLGGFAVANGALTDPLGPDSHDDLGTRAAFVRAPGRLADNVRHIKLETDERRTWRRVGDSLTADDVVSLRQQRNPVVDADAAERRVLRAGHVGVLNDAGRISAELRLALDDLLGSRLDQPMATRRTGEAARR